MILVEKYKIRTLLDFGELVRQPGHEAAGIWPRLRLKKNFQQMVSECCAANNFSEVRLTFQQRVQKTTRSSDPRVAVFADNFEMLFEVNQIPKLMWRRVIAIMSRTSDVAGKQRCVYMTGPASSGKSSVMLLLSSVYESFEQGRFGPQNINSQFWLQDLLGKEIYLGDEALATPLNIQTYLLLLEGNKDLATEVKYQGNELLKAKPVIVACNNHIFAECQGFADAIMSRVVHLEFLHKCPKDLNIRPPPSLLPFILKELAVRMFLK